MSNDIRKFYLSVGKKQLGLAAELLKLLNTHFNYTQAEFRQAGGEDGDLFRETAELRTYPLWGGSGWLQVYIVTDDNTNGHGATISVLYCPPDRVDSESYMEKLQELLDFLDQADFVPKHKALQERTCLHANFGSYLDERYAPGSQAPFVVKK